MMTRSKGNSKIIGAAIAAIAALVNRTPHASRFEASKTMRNRTATAVMVTGWMGLAALGAVR